MSNCNIIGYLMSQLKCLFYFSGGLNERTIYNKEVIYRAVYKREPGRALITISNHRSYLDACVLPSKRSKISLYSMANPPFYDGSHSYQNFLFDRDGLLVVNTSLGRQYQLVCPIKYLTQKPTKLIRTELVKMTSEASLPPKDLKNIHQSVYRSRRKMFPKPPKSMNA